MKKIIWSFIIFCLITTINANSFAEEITKEKMIRELLELTGALTTTVSEMDTIMEQMKNDLSTELSPSILDEYIFRFRREVSEDKIAELAIPIFLKHFSEKEIKEILEFNKTPTAQKWNRLSPKIARELELAGEEWGRKIGVKIIKEIIIEYQE